MTLTVGLGAVHDGWSAFETDPGRKVRAELLDEGLAVLAGLWGGQPFSYEGAHHRVRPTEFMLPAPPVQQPRIPVWVVGAWPRPRSMRRAARWDGWVPNFLPPAGDPAWDGPTEDGQPVFTPDRMREAVSWLREHRAAEGLDLTGYDVVWEGSTPADDPAAAAETVAPWADAGATWWLETLWTIQGDQDAVTQACRRRLEAGPPR